VITNEQIRTVKTAQRFLQMDDASYRTVLRNVGGGVNSCKALGQEGFEDVMAYFESQGFGGEGAHKWTDIVATRGSFANTRMVWMIQQLHAQYEAAREPDETHYELSGLVFRQSKNRTRDVDRLTPAEAWALIEAIKKMIQRLACGEIPGPNGKHWPSAGLGLSKDLPF